jgi:hypothetical protein
MLYSGAKGTMTPNIRDRQVGVEHQFADGILTSGGTRPKADAEGYHQQAVKESFAI